MSVLVVAGDFYAPAGSVPTADPELRTLLTEADFAMVNLEGPLAGAGGPSLKTGPSLRQDPSSPRVLKAFGFDAVTLANNHIFDHGLDALVATAEACESAGLRVVGANLPTGDASQLRIDLGGVPVTVINACEEEWVRSAGGFGASVFTVPAVGRAIAAELSLGRRVVVVLHGGNEYFPLPNPSLRENARFLVELGASAVLVHHTHVVSAVESWQGRPIAYGLGNFDFVMSSPAEGFQEGLLAALEFTADDPAPMITLIPTTFDPTSGHVELATGQRKASIEWKVRSYAEILQSPSSYAAHWKEFVRKNTAAYLQYVQTSAPASSGLVSRVSTRLAARNLLSNPERAAVLLNVMRCEAHRVAAVEALTALLDEERVAPPA